MVEQHHECCVKVAEKQGSQEKQGTNSNLKCDAGVHKDLLNGQGHLNALYVLNLHNKTVFFMKISKKKRFMIFPDERKGARDKYCL